MSKASAHHIQLPSIPLLLTGLAERPLMLTGLAERPFAVERGNDEQWVARERHEQVAQCQVDDQHVVRRPQTSKPTTTAALSSSNVAH